MADHSIAQVLSLRAKLVEELSAEQQKLQRMAECSASASETAAARKANRSWIKRLDHMLQTSLGVGLDHFVPKRRLAALAKDERRYLTEVPRPVDGVLETRSCLDLPGNVQTFELPRVMLRGQPQAPALHFSCDQGSIGMPSIHFLIHSEGLRATCCYDIWHRLHNDLLDSVTASGMMLTRLQYLNVCRIRRGPFAGQANTSIMREAAKEMLHSLTFDNPLFEALYEDIVYAEARLRSQPHVGTERHMKETWEFVCSKLMAIGCGSLAKNSRWWSWEVQSRDAVGRRWMDLMLLLFIGSKRKWWKGAADSPLNGRGQVFSDDGDAPLPGEGNQSAGDEAHDKQRPDQAGEEEDTAGMGVGKRLGVAAGRKAVAKQRQVCCNTLHYCCKLLTNDLGCRLWEGMAHLPAPLETWFGEGVGRIKTPLGVQDFMQELAGGELDRLVPRLFEQLFSSSFAQAIGLCRPEHLDTDYLRKQDSAVIGRMWDMCVCLSGHIILTSLSYQTPPHSFALLCSKDPQTVKDRIQKHRRAGDGKHHIVC